MCVCVRERERQRVLVRDALVSSDSSFLSERMVLMFSASSRALAPRRIVPEMGQVSHLRHVATGDAMRLSVTYPWSTEDARRLSVTCLHGRCKEIVSYMPVGHV